MSRYALAAASRVGQGTAWQAVSSIAPSSTCVARTVQCAVTIATAAADAFSKLVYLDVCITVLGPQFGPRAAAPGAVYATGKLVMLGCRRSHSGC